MDATELDLLVQRIQKGDKESFRDLYFALEHELRIFISAHSISADMVDEVLQAAFVSGYENIQKYELRGTFQSWLKGVARNRLLKELEERKRFRDLESDALEAAVAHASLKALQEQERETDLLFRLEECLQRLTVRSRELLAQRYTQRMPVKELARAQEKTETWISVTLYRIRESLRVCLEENGVAP